MRVMKKRLKKKSMNLKSQVNSLLETDAEATIVLAKAQLNFQDHNEKPFNLVCVVIKELQISTKNGKLWRRKLGYDLF